jgi:hypothetical protein
MSLTQLSVQLSDQPGELNKIGDLLGEEGINIRAFSASVHGDDSQFHMVVDATDKAFSVLSAKGFKVTERPVIAVETPDHPGGLKAVLNPLAQSGINVEFLYSVIGRFQQNAVLIIGVKETEKAVAALQKSYIRILDADFLPKT